jgi:hypothetical protein
MAEPRRQENQEYVDRRELQNEREGVFSEKESGAQYANKPRLVSSEETRSASDTQISAAESDNPSGQAANSPTPLFSATDVGELRSRWASIQAGFVDEPRWAVKEADKLVATAVDRLTTSFADRRSELEKQWDRGESVSTEELRLVLQSYRTFFDRLLNI